MDDKDDITPFPREPWQKLLAGSRDGPSEMTDARIRAAARRDLAPRGRRWWLPASLAASFVLAVFIVQSQFGTIRMPAVSESGGDGGTIHARIIDREEADAARPAGEAPAARSMRVEKPRETEEADVFGYQESELAADSAGAGPKIGGPEHDLQVATESPEAALEPDLPAAPPAAVAASAPREIRSLNAAADVALLRREALPHSASPEAWYAEIERLRAAGEEEEADRQLERLEIVYPGWLAQREPNLAEPDRR